jgi:hypothetical protein
MFCTLIYVMLCVHILLKIDHTSLFLNGQSHLSRTFKPYGLKRPLFQKRISRKKLQNVIAIDYNNSDDVKIHRRLISF